MRLVYLATAVVTILAFAAGDALTRFIERTFRT